MLLAVDIGNTRIKVAVFEGSTLLEQFYFNSSDLQNELHFILNKYKKASELVVASVGNIPKEAFLEFESKVNIHFISSGLGGVKFSAFKGWIPGAFSSAAEINPFGLFQAFQMGSTPDCQSISLETIDANNNVSAATNYVATIDLKNMPPSWFSGERNPVTGQTSREAFTQRTPCTKRTGSIPNGTLSSLYHMTIGILCLVILYGLTKRMSK